MKIYLTIMNKERHFTFTKYFNTIEEKENYKRRIKYICNLIIIEDSEDIIYYG